MHPQGWSTSVTSLISAYAKYVSDPGFGASAGCIPSQKVFGAEIWEVADVAASHRLALESHALAALGGSPSVTL
jgi:hypothetical protein